MKIQKVNNNHVRQTMRVNKITVRNVFKFILGMAVSMSACANYDDFSSVATDKSAQKKLKFNSAFIHGLSIDVSRFSEGNPTPSGEYAVLVVVNGIDHGRHVIRFRASKGEESAQACFDERELTRLGIKFSTNPLQFTTKNRKKNETEKTQCAPIDKWVTGARAEYTFGDFQLNLNVPQAYLIHYPRGYTDPNSWDSGVALALFDYNSNLYFQHSSGNNNGRNNQAINGNVGLLSGLNFYDWRLRNRLNSSWTSGGDMHTRSLSTYLQRDIPALKSQLTLGDGTTSGYLFDSLMVRGIQLQSDDRMLPDGLRFYYPMIRGIAETNARVTVKQRGQILYETTVPPGAFELSDIGLLGYGGDLQVTIQESDGRQRNQTVPFSAPPMLLHDGVSRFSATVGKLVDDSLTEKPSVAQVFLQRGLGNTYTLYGGGQISEDYNAVGIGNAFNTQLGGVSVDVTRSSTQLKNGKTSEGNSYNVTYSKYMDPTETDITLAAWRYSSKGYYSLRDAALERFSSNNSARVDYRTRQRFSLTLGQPLWNGGRINFTGSYYNYWSDKSATSQYTLTYNKSETHFSWAVSASQTYSSHGQSVNNLMLSLSVPLGGRSIVAKPAFSSLYSTLLHDSKGRDAFRVSASGSQGRQNEFSYGIGAAVNRASTERGVLNGNASYNSRYGQFGTTASIANHSSQFSLSANGSLVAHQGGLTAGPRLGDYPFALVEAPGAKGAKLMNGYGSEIDANGFAIVPSLTPYRKNTIAVNTEGLPVQVDVLEGESTVIPRMGAAVKVNVKTLIGDPVFLIVKNSNGTPLPIGSDIYDSEDKSIGIVGQGGMAFIRGWQADKDNLYIKGASGQRMCTIYANASTAHKINIQNDTVAQEEVVCH
ncbi:MAG: fimbria/pilus outer membrane usher protein [Pantoea sp.]|nr:fimbria/pilus outer membrane usher protein [Pantoea sp.]MDU5783155.1 fimbria/pilus outer membrane usher protein [Pantoea sp.]